MGTIKTHTTTIDGIQYTTKTFPAAEGLQLLPRLISLLGEQVLSLFIAGRHDIEHLAETPEVLAAMLARIADNAKDGGLLVFRDLLRYTEADKVSIGDTQVPGSVFEHFDEHFAGRYGHLLKVCLWVARVSFSEP